jgi:trans-aconitate 2-methyltransferase
VSKTVPAETWDPGIYAAFAQERMRPALDLIDRIELSAPERVVDLGCGSGRITRRLAARWPDAGIIGIDSSAAMLAQAAAPPSAIRWLQIDIAAWQADEPPELIFSNAALHWLADHRRLFPRLVAQLGDGGLLAVQMPRSFDDPLHTAIAATVAAGPWQSRLAPLCRPEPVTAPEAYVDLLSPLVSDLDVWETVYFHLLSGEDAALTWARGAALRPFLAALTADEHAPFLTEYRRRLAGSYPRRDDGRTLLPYRRLFIIARR